MAENTSANAPATSVKLPRGVPFIIGNEAAERFSYYGMLSILTLYLSKEMGLGNDKGKEVVHWFATAVYFLPLFGAWLADRWLGRYWTILSISMFYCAGHLALSVFEGNLTGIYFGLALLAIGAGGIKPCVSAFVGDQFPPGNEKGLTRVYGWFYWSINFGATFGFALIPWLRKEKGYSWAFGVPGIAMAVATLIFWLGRNKYVRQPPQRDSKEAGIFSVLFNPRNDEERASARAVRRIFLVFLTVPVFFALYNQVNSTWVLQGEKMTPFNVMGFTVDGETMQAVGSILVMIWVPIMTYALYPLAERARLRPTPLRRMAVGMVLAGVTYIISGWLQERIDAGEKLSLAWQLIPYVVLVAGEVLVSATGLEYAFEQAPKTMRSMMMSLWLLTIAGGHFLIAAFTNLNANYIKASGAKELYFYAGLMFVVTFLFMGIARWAGKHQAAKA